MLFAMCRFIDIYNEEDYFVKSKYLVRVDQWILEPSDFISDINVFLRERASECLVCVTVWCG